MPMMKIGLGPKVVTGLDGAGRENKLDQSLLSSVFRGPIVAAAFELIPRKRELVREIVRRRSRPRYRPAHRAHAPS